MGKQFLRGGHASARDGRPGLAAISAKLLPAAQRELRADARRAKWIGGTVVALLGLILICAVGVLAAGGRRGRANMPDLNGAVPGAVPRELPNEMGGPPVGVGGPPVGIGGDAADVATEHRRRFEDMREKARQRQEEVRERINQARQRATP